jgi:hypothetical protein
MYLSVPTRANEREGAMRDGNGRPAGVDDESLDVLLDGDIDRVMAGMDRIVEAAPSYRKLISRWGSQGSKPGQMDLPHGIAADKDGSVYVSGVIGGALPGQSAIGIRDAFVRKYDADGTAIWTDQFGTFGTDWARAIVADGTAISIVWLMPRKS